MAGMYALAVSGSVAFRTISHEKHGHAQESPGQ
jgi:hypothetical protein